MSSERDTTTQTTSPPRKSELARTKVGKLAEVQVPEAYSQEGSEHLLSFFKAETVGNALRNREWTVEKEMGILIDIASNEDESAWTRVGVIRELHNRRKEAVMMGGYTETLTRHMEATGPRGEKLTMQSQSMRLLEGDYQAGKELVHEVAVKDLEEEPELVGIPASSMEDIDDESDGIIDAEFSERDDPETEDEDGELDEGELYDALSELKGEDGDTGLADKLASGVAEGYKFREGHTPPRKGDSPGLARPDQNIHLGKDRNQ